MIKKYFLEIRNKYGIELCIKVNLKCYLYLKYAIHRQYNQFKVFIIMDLSTSMQCRLDIEVLKSHCISFAFKSHFTFNFCFSNSYFTSDISRKYMKARLCNSLYCLEGQHFLWAVKVIITVFTAPKEFFNFVQHCHFPATHIRRVHKVLPF